MEFDAHQIDIHLKRTILPIYIRGYFFLVRVECSAIGFIVDQPPTVLYWSSFTHQA